MLYSVDRIEGQLVELVGDDGSRLQLCIGQFETAPEEGLLLRKTERGFVVDEQATHERRRELADKMKKLLEKNESL